MGTSALQGFAAWIGCSAVQLCVRIPSQHPTARASLTAASDCHLEMHVSHVARLMDSVAARMETSASVALPIAVAGAAPTSL